MTGVMYPSRQGCSTCDIVSGSAYTFAYDNMGRMNTGTDTVNTRTLVSGMTSHSPEWTPDREPTLKAAIRAEVTALPELFKGQ